jgi:multiple sugar transport system substrate-binding protein
MKRSIVAGLAVTLAASLALAGCDSGSESGGPSSSGPVTLTLAGWTLASSPEFQALADAFHRADSTVTVRVKEYDAANYDTQMIADLSAGKAPDIYVQKNLKNFFTYQSGQQLMDVSDVAAGIGGDVPALKPYQVGGKTYAVPFRADSWYLYYNKDLFSAAKVAPPDGTWTWDDYEQAARQLTAGLAARGVKGAYQHTWQSLVQGFALAQTPGADLLSGDYGYLTPYYERSLRLQSADAQVPFGTATTSQLTYQSQFGKQKAAMMLMGSWYVATLLRQQKSGEADTFGWGLAPAPQRDASTVSNPVTFGDPTAMGINPRIDRDKVSAAKRFLTFVSGPDGAKVIAGLGHSPAVTPEAVRAAYFAVPGIPTDDLSRRTFETHTTKPENPVAKATATVQNVLSDAHSAIMSGSNPVDRALAEAAARARSEALGR